MVNLFLLEYEHCGESWSQTWDCQVNDKCPKCSCEIEPSNVHEENGNGQEKINLC